MKRHAAVDALSAVGLFALGGSGTASSGGPQQHTQAPGFYRVTVGDFEVTALSDGTVPQVMDKLLIGIDPKEVEARVARDFAKLPLETSINGFLINTGTRLSVVDTGAGELFGK